MSATPDSTLADLQRSNADLQRELAARTAERDEALDQQPRPLRYCMQFTKIAARLGHTPDVEGSAEMAESIKPQPLEAAE